MNMQPEMDHTGALERLNEGLRLALEQADGDPSMLGWLLGATLVSMGQQGFLDADLTARAAVLLGESAPRNGAG